MSAPAASRCGRPDERRDEHEQGRCHDDREEGVVADQREEQQAGDRHASRGGEHGRVAPRVHERDGERRHDPATSGQRLRPRTTMGGGGEPTAIAIAALRGVSERAASMPMQAASSAHATPPAPNEIEPNIANMPAAAQSQKRLRLPICWRVNP